MNNEITINVSRTVSDTISLSEELAENDKHFNSADLNGSSKVTF